MKKEEIKLDDIKRILIGNAPVEFLLETLLRTLFIFLVFIVVMRLFGKRMTGQLTITEFGVVITLGAIIAPMMQLPDKGLLQGVFLLLCILGMHRLITAWGVKSQKVEKITQGELSLLVKDGIIQEDELKASRIPKNQLFAAIRAKNIYNLGQVERLYLEACGAFSLYTTEENKPGLSILPSFEETPLPSILTSLDHNLKACSNCGNTQQITGNETHCDICDCVCWNEAVITNDAVATDN